MKTGYFFARRITGSKVIELIIIRMNPHHYDMMMFDRTKPVTTGVAGKKKQ
jgi:hypothetical protein